MKVLVATGQTQGKRPNDFNTCVEGELVWIGLVCSKDARNPDGGCGCGRAFGGLTSRRSTTTAWVVDRDFSRDSYIRAVQDSFQRQGWPDSLADEVCDDLLELAARWPVGTVVERRLDEVRVRGAVPVDGVSR
ncbi:hypothetical protein D5S17_26255 [Pseudonocardiaceae bacterium YIM PH 21723]|nr:hypothetical protein D5S17_26255 [Pseudonocardiaceae bacterium YIM PH 21723]